MASVYARAADLIGGHGHPDWRDTIVVSVAFQAGGIGTLEANWRSGYGYDSRLEVQTANGMLKVDSELSSRLSHHDSGGRRQSYPHGFLDCFADAYRREIAGFVRALAYGAAPAPGLQDAVDSLCAADAIEVSLRENRPVAVDYANL